MDEVDGGGAQHSGWFERVGDGGGPAGARCSACRWHYSGGAWVFRLRADRSFTCSRGPVGWHDSSRLAEAAGLRRRRTPAELFTENFCMGPIAPYPTGTPYTRKNT